jgi:ATP-binding protein involved in chromosome partitioning
VPFLGEVPLTITIREMSDAGRPLAAVDPNGPNGRIYRDIARQV